MTVEEGLPDVVTWDLLAAVSRPDPEFCFHPRAVTEYRVLSAFRWTRVRRGSRWRLRRASFRQLGVYTMRCPDCPAWASQQETPGSAVSLRLAPWWIPTTNATPDDCNGGA